VGGPPPWTRRGVLTDPKNKHLKKCHKRTSDSYGFLDKRRILRKMDWRFGTWNARRLYRAGSLITVAKVLSKYKLDLVRTASVV
jgi:hypothetical protein